MYKTILLLVFTAFSLTTTAQNWLTDFEAAKQQAKEQNKPIILVFQGSDWCAPCIKLDRQIWSSEPFKKYAQDHFIMMQADFPRKKKNALSEAIETQNKRLAETYNKQGIFPFVAILNAQGDVLGHTGYKKLTPEEYIAHLNTFLK